MGDEVVRVEPTGRPQKALSPLLPSEVAAQRLPSRKWALPRHQNVRALILDFPASRLLK